MWVCNLTAITCEMLSCFDLVCFFKETFIYESSGSKGRPPSLQTSKTKLSCFLQRSSSFSCARSSLNPLVPSKETPFQRPLRRRQTYRDAGKKGELQRRIEWIVKKSGEIDERTDDVWKRRWMEDRGEIEEFSEPTAQDKKEGDEREDMLYQSGRGWVHIRHQAPLRWFNNLSHLLTLGYNKEERRQKHKRSSVSVLFTWTWDLQTFLLN